MKFMARIRTIKPSFWTDEKIGKLSFGARLLFIASWNLADDEGIIIWNESYLRGQVFPYEKKLPLSQVKRMMDELIQQKLCVFYRCGCDSYAFIPGFHKHQVISKGQPSTKPLPTSPDFKAKFTDMGWEVCPESLYDLLMDIKEKYQNIPVIITENGGAFPDQNFEEKMVLDDDRVDYLKGHLTSVWKAIEHGCIVQGYYVWSLLDNFEWGLGYSKRFGIIRVDYKSLERSIKKSGFFYQNIIQNRGL